MSEYEALEIEIEDLERYYKNAFNCLYLKDCIRA